MFIPRFQFGPGNLGKSHRKVLEIHWSKCVRTLLMSNLISYEPKQVPVEIKLAIVQRIGNDERHLSKEANGVSPRQADFDKILGVIRKPIWQGGHRPSLGPDEEQSRHLVHVCQRRFPCGHLKHRATHAPYVGLPAISCLVDNLSGQDDTVYDKSQIHAKRLPEMSDSCPVHARNLLFL